MTKVIDELKGRKLSGFPWRNLLTEWQGIVSKCKGARANKN